MSSESKNEREPEKSSDSRLGGDDAICFPAGVSGAIFGTGAIHAYLAADRQPPLVAAGISFGALCAAAMQRCFKESERSVGDPESPLRESRRWRWFNKFLKAMTEKPLGHIWRALPSRSDFLVGAETSSDPTTPDFLGESEKYAAHRRDLLVTLGRWILRLPISIKEIARLSTSFSRFIDSFVLRKISVVLYFPWLIWNAFCTGERLAIYIAVEPLLGLGGRKRRPFFGRNGFFYWDRFLGWRPVFGWPIYFLSLFLVISNLLLLCTVGTLVANFIFDLSPLSLPFEIPWWFWYWNLGLCAVIWLAGPRIFPLILLAGLAYALYEYDPDPVTIDLKVIISLAVVWTMRIPWLVFESCRNLAVKTLSNQVLESLDIENGLVDNFHLRRSLYELFKEDGEDGADSKGSAPGPTVNDGEVFPVVIVADALEPLGKRRRDVNSERENSDATFYKQLFARERAPLVDALTIALRRVRLMGSTKLNIETARKYWFEQNVDLWSDGEPPGADSEVHLVAGSLTRRNPLPALFRYLRYDRKRKESSESTEKPIEDRLTSCHKWGKRAIHVLYEVPRGAPQSQHADSVSTEGAASEGSTGDMDIVDLGFLAPRLADRRDTQLEVKQTNFISGLGCALGGGEASSAGGRPIAKLFADEIPPTEDIVKAEDLLGGRSDKLLEYVAHGCRRTLETLYKEEIIDELNKLSEANNGSLASGEKTLPCHFLLKRVAPNRISYIEEAHPGWPEVCQSCLRSLNVVSSPEAAASPKVDLGNEIDLSGKQPRIVVVASGGVFRGTFHVGLVGALWAARVRPDLIAGASVGTLLGGALGALQTLEQMRDNLDKLANEKEREAEGTAPRSEADALVREVKRYRKEAKDKAQEAKELMRQLVECFVEVDSRVALTRRFRDLVREVSSRAETIVLSPSDVRRLAIGGARSDPGYAATGAPPPLIDAISRLFLLPYDITREVASKFVAGEEGKAISLLLKGIKRHTLRRLDIEQAIVDRSLLERVAIELMNANAGSIDYTRLQPFIRDGGIAFLATATDLDKRTLCNFGLDDICPQAPYDFIKAALASSAFPSVFAPLRQSEIFPGIGRHDVLYSDGGMFDNLPFVPAVDSLVDFQQKELGDKSPAELRDWIKGRFDEPDLFLVGSLSVNATAKERLEVARLRPYRHAEGSFHEQVKIRSFENLSLMIDRHCKALGEVDVGDKRVQQRFEGQRRALTGIVNAAVMPIYPSTKEHLNPTFAFATSLGLRKERVLKSMAHGCFQTLRSFWDATSAFEEGHRKEGTRDGLLGRSFKALNEGGRMPMVKFRDQRQASPSSVHTCPFFMMQNKEYLELELFECPFTRIGPGYGEKIFKSCTKDPEHKSIIKKGKVV